ncbi:hypothetical protein MT418_006539 [Batrachochytrium dendrobatidis]
MLIVFLTIAIIIARVASASEPFIIDKEFAAVTCGSGIKLVNKATGARLHSHEVHYGSGSGRQSVTGYPKGDDPNSLFVVGAALSGSCSRGQPVHCGDSIRLQHLNTRQYLHSQSGIQSPMSKNQEVSGHDQPGTGDNWIVQCLDSKEKLWGRERNIKLGMSSASILSFYY